MANGNGDMTMKVMQAIAMETHQIKAMVDKIGTMSAQQAKLLDGMNNIMGNLTGLSMLLNCMQVAQLEVMEPNDKYEVTEIYEELCKKYGVKPLTGEIITDESKEG